MDHPEGVRGNCLLGLTSEVSYLLHPKHASLKKAIGSYPCRLLLSQRNNCRKSNIITTMPVCSWSKHSAKFFSIQMKHIYVCNKWQASASPSLYHDQRPWTDWLTNYYWKQTSVCCKVNCTSRYPHLCIHHQLANVSGNICERYAADKFVRLTTKTLLPIKVHQKHPFNILYSQSMAAKLIICWRPAQRS